MARPIHLTHHLSPTISQAGYAAATLFLCAFALFMCASHNPRKWRKWRYYYCHGYEYDEPVIELSQPEMMNEFEFGNVEVERTAPSGEVSSIWKKNILMGGKCQLPDFSGVIIYDSTGNVVAPAKAPLALTWK